MKRTIITMIGTTALCAPLFAFAIPAADLGGIGQTIAILVGFINKYLVPAIFALAFLLFIWGMFKFFFLSYANEEGRSEGKQLMLWAVIAFVVMVSIWGLVNVVANGLGFSGETAPTTPTIPVPGSTASAPPTAPAATPTASAPGAAPCQTIAGQTVC